MLQISKEIKLTLMKEGKKKKDIHTRIVARSATIFQRQQAPKIKFAALKSAVPKIDG